MQNKNNKILAFQVTILVVCLMITALDNKLNFFINAQTSCGPDTPPLNPDYTKESWFPGTASLNKEVAVRIDNKISQVDRDDLSDGIRKWNDVRDTTCSYVKFPNYQPIEITDYNEDPPSNTVVVVQQDSAFGNVPAMANFYGGSPQRLPGRCPANL